MHVFAPLWMPGSHRGQKWPSDLLELVLQIPVSCHADTGNWGHLEKGPGLLTAEPSPLAFEYGVLVRTCLWKLSPTSPTLVQPGKDPDTYSSLWCLASIGTLPCLMSSWHQWNKNRHFWPNVWHISNSCPWLAMPRSIFTKRNVPRMSHAQGRQGTCWALAGCMGAAVRTLNP